MEFITSNTNKKIVITPATFQEASELKKETMKCISQANLLKDLDFTNFASLDANKIFKAVAELITNIDSSPDFENAWIVWLTFIISEFVTAVIAIYLMLRIYKRKIKHL